MAGRSAHNARMHEREMRIHPHLSSDASQGGYSLKAEHPRLGEAMVEAYASMPAVVARASELIQAGYRIGISSPASLEEH